MAPEHSTGDPPGTDNDLCALVREQMVAGAVPHTSPSQLVRASAPRWITLGAERFRTVSEEFRAPTPRAELRVVAAELSELSIQMADALTAVATSIKTENAGEYRAGRDLTDELQSKLERALTSGAAACQRVASAERAEPSGGRLPKEHIQSVVVSGRLIPNAPEEFAALEFLKETNGTLPPLRSASTDIPDNDVIECVGSNFYRARFQPPEGNGTVMVTYPIVFSLPD